jgi:CheY-specific phosphatase CheX
MGRCALEGGGAPERRGTRVWAQLSEEALVKASAQFWEQMLQMQLDRVPCTENFCVGSGHLRASVSLSGMWTGRIEVRFAQGLAQAATAAMMMQPAEAVSEADVLDAIREIANMIGGVIKSSLPRPCLMTLPESGVANEMLCVQAGNGDSLAVAFRHPAGGLMVRVWEEACAG